MSAFAHRDEMLLQEVLHLKDRDTLGRTVVTSKPIVEAFIDAAVVLPCFSTSEGQKSRLPKPVQLVNYTRVLLA